MWWCLTLTWIAMRNHSQTAQLQSFATLSSFGNLNLIVEARYLTITTLEVEYTRYLILINVVTEALVENDIFHDFTRSELAEYALHITTTLLKSLQKLLPYDGLRIHVCIANSTINFSIRALFFSIAWQLTVQAVSLNKLPKWIIIRIIIHLCYAAARIVITVLLNLSQTSASVLFKWGC